MAYILTTPITPLLGGGLILGLQEEIKEREPNKQKEDAPSEDSPPLLSAEFLFSISPGSALLCSECFTMASALHRAGGTSQLKLWLTSFLTVVMAITGMGGFWSFWNDQPVSEWTWQRIAELSRISRDGARKKGGREEEGGTFSLIHPFIVHWRQSFGIYTWL